MRHANPPPRRFVRAFPGVSRASARPDSGIPLLASRGSRRHDCRGRPIPATHGDRRVRLLTGSCRVPRGVTSTAADPNASVVAAGEPSEAGKPVGATDAEASDAAPAETADAAGHAPRDGAEASVSFPGGAETAAAAVANAVGVVASPSVSARPSSPLPTCTLHEAAELGDVASLEKLLLLDASCDVDARDASGATPLVVAAAASRSEAAQFLLSRGADPNATNARGDTALHWACYRGDAAAARALLRAGADVRARGDVGNTPLHMACTEHHEEIARELLSRGADVLARNDVQITPLGVATSPSLRATVKSVETDGDAARARVSAEARELALEAANAKAALEAMEAKRREDDETQRILELEEARTEAAALGAELAAIRAAEAEVAREAEEERARVAAEKAKKKGKGGGKGKKGK